MRAKPWVHMIVKMEAVYSGKYKKARERNWKAGKNISLGYYAY